MTWDDADFDSPDPLVRYNAHQAAKGRSQMPDPDERVERRVRQIDIGLARLDRRSQKELPKERPEGKSDGD